MRELSQVFDSRQLIIIGTKEESWYVQPLIDGQKFRTLPHG